MNDILSQEIVNDLNNILKDLNEIFKNMHTDTINIDEYIIENIHFNYPQPDEYGIANIIDSLSDISNLSKKKDISEIADIITDLYNETISQDQFLNIFKLKN